MPEMTPDELRAAFADVDEPILPPGSMTLETAREVANRFASAWQADRKRLGDAERERDLFRERLGLAPVLDIALLDYQRWQRDNRAALAGKDGEP